MERLDLAATSVGKPGLNCLIKSGQVYNGYFCSQQAWLIPCHTWSQASYLQAPLDFSSHDLNHPFVKRVPLQRLAYWIYFRLDLPVLEKVF